MSREHISYHPTPEREPNIENGRDVTVRIHFLRHAPYDAATGRLTENGRRLASEFGQQIEPLGDGETYLAKFESSQIPRARETAMALLSGIQTNRRGTPRSRNELGQPDESGNIDDLEAFYRGKPEHLGSRLQTSRDLAGRVAKRILELARMSERFRSGSRVDLVSVSHLPWLTAFLHEVGGSELEIYGGRTVEEQQGGQLRYLEGFTVIVARNESGELTMTLEFRGQRTSLDMESLGAMVPTDNENE